WRGSPAKRKAAGLRGLRPALQVALKKTQRRPPGTAPRPLHGRGEKQDWQASCEEVARFTCEEKSRRAAGTPPCGTGRKKENTKAPAGTAPRPLHGRGEKRRG